MGQPQPTTADARKAYGTRVAVMAGSGALYTLVALWCAQALGDAVNNGRVLPDPVGDGAYAFVLLGFTVLPLTFLAAWLLQKTTAGRFGTTWGLTWRWVLGVFGLWLTALATGDVGLPVFLIYWPAFAWLVTPRKWSPPVTKAKRGNVYPLPNDIKPQPSRRRANRGGTPGNHGRIPKETEVLLRELVRQVTGPVANGLPNDAPPAVRRATNRLVLEAVMQSWWDEQRAEPLDAIDVERLRSVVALAADVVEHRFDAVGQGAYRGLLRGLLSGWLLRRL